ncbi:DNA replication factor C [Turnera subulata]|uniref:DNA replication factor C n=1 Tax=Turnera subulata TaxID=218843 RepID=A0A9Q0G353_9ROSI|nr:DNA replication factor C [Turnera subulata]
MERSRSKRNYYYDHQDYDNDNVGRTKPRYGNSHHGGGHSNSYPHSRHRGGGGGGISNPNYGGGGGGNSNSNGPSSNAGGGGRMSSSSSSSSKSQQDNLMVTTSYRILCHDLKAGGVIGKSGSIIKSIRQHTGAWINVHELMPGDEERIIEISDTRRRDPEGRMPSFSPAQEALFLIHERILESEGGPEDEYGSNGGGGAGGGGGGGNGNYRVATRLVVSRMHVGCLLGKGGKIIEQMRMETKTQIRILPRDHTLPRCVSMSEEIVQVVGDTSAVKNAIAIISSRLRESQHRDRSHFHGRLHSPDRFFPDDDYIPHMNTGRRSSVDGPPFGSRGSGNNYRGGNNSSRQSGVTVEGPGNTADSVQQPFYTEEIVFRMLCPVDRVNRVVGDSEGIVELLQNEIGVDVKVADPVTGSDEQIITISSEESPDDELFPAQEALLHIQTRIVDLYADKENSIRTRLLVPFGEITCLEGRDGSLSEMERLTGAKIHIVPKDKLPACVSGGDELIQIEGEIKAARDALVEVTSRLRSYLYKELWQKDAPPPYSAQGPVGGALGVETASPRDGHNGGDASFAGNQHVQSSAAAQTPKDARGSGTDALKQNESERREDLPTTTNRIPVTLVTRSILEVVIPEPAVPKLVTKSKNKLAQISELSGANVTLVEDRPGVTEKIIQISGTPEQAERAQSLLQGFILSSKSLHLLADMTISSIVI